ncbi:MAG: ankyrin repeat domain-containing protein [Alphaproteobacteria bacterium]|nr:ankyrin repeat domain-containing protein [Alphaproteobacteria bacterium]
MKTIKETPLTWYAYLGVKPERKIKEFLASGGDINTPDVYGKTILHHVVEHIPGTNLMKFLIQRGADVNAKESDTWTPLHLAANVPSYAKAKLLLENGADITAKVKDEETPLHIAAWYNDTRLVHLLINWGADLRDGSGEHGTPLETAYYFRQYKTVRALETCIYKQKIAETYRSERYFEETRRKVTTKQPQKRPLSPSHER